MSLGLHVYKELDDYTLNVQFDAERGKTLALLGAGGSGKSAALRCIAGFETPDRGRIVLHDSVLFDSAKRVNLPPQRRRVGYLHRHYALFSRMTAEENLYAAVSQLSKPEQTEAVEEKLEAFRLTDVVKKRPARLTNAQRLRLALARLMLTAPEALLLDDPFHELDEHLKWQTELELNELLRGYPGCVILATDDRGTVARLCAEACVLTDGHSEETMTVRDLMAQPLSVSAAALSGCKNFSRVKRIDASHVQCLNWGVTLETTQRVNNVCTYAGIRDRALHIARSGEPNRFDARVVRVIEDVFSVILLLAPEGGNALLRMELSRDEYTALRRPDVVLLGVEPKHVMTLTGELEDA